MVRPLHRVFFPRTLSVIAVVVKASMKCISRAVRKGVADISDAEKRFPFVKVECGAMADGDPNKLAAVNRPKTNQHNIDTDEDIQNDLLRKKQRESQLYWNQYFLCATICMAWIFGTFGFSIAWVLLLAIIIHIIMWGSFSRLLEDCVIFEKRKVHRRKALLHDESAEWLNFILNRWWLFSSTSIFNWLKANVETLINEASLPMLDSVRLKDFTLGDKTPFITSVRAFDTNSVNAPLFSSNLKGLSPSEKSDVVHSLKYRLVIHADVGIICPDFKMTFTGKVSPGLEVDLVFENLKVTGHIQSTIQFSMDAAFPHISKATVTFTEKPTVNFDIKCLRSTTEMMTTLGIRDWFNSFIMDILTGAIVDPFQLEINFAAMDYPLPGQTTGNSLAEGVLTVTVGWLHKSGKSASPSGKNEDERWCVLRLGGQKYTSAKSIISSNWTVTHSFLVEKLVDDKIIIKIKNKKLFGTSTLAEFTIPLIDCFQDRRFMCDDKLQKKGVFYAYLQMQYEPLMPLQIDSGKEVDEVDGLPHMPSSKAGVIYICIHGADGLLTESKHLPNPYCVIFYNTKKVKTTHYVSQTCNPCWESSTEFLVADIAQTSLQIAVSNYDISKMADAGCLGLATVNLNSLTKEYVMQQMSISMEASSDEFSNDRKCGSLLVSVLFRPSQSVEQSGSNFIQKCHIVDSAPSSLSKLATINSPLINTAKFLVPNLADMPISSTAGCGPMEIRIIKARNLMAKDLFGYSDPFCEFHINQDSFYRTCVKKRTLNPIWDEKFVIGTPKVGDVLNLVVWDRDNIGKDFLGRLSLNAEDIQQLLMKDGSQWFTLNESKSGEIELQLRIISESFSTENLDATQQSCKTSSTSGNTTPVLDNCKTTQNFYGDGNLGYSPEESKSETSINNIKEDYHLPSKVGNQHQTSSISNYNTAVESALPQTTSLSTKLDNPSVDQAVPQLKNPIHQESLSSVDQTELKQIVSKEPEVIKRNHKLDGSKYNLSKSKLKPVVIPSPPERKSSLPTPEIKPSSDIVVSEAVQEPTTPISRGSTAYSSLQGIRQKVRKTFSHPLRRFRSEVNVRDDKLKPFQERVTMESRDLFSSCNNIEIITSDSLENSSIGLDQLVEPGEGASKKNQEETTRYYNVHGTVVQASGLDVKNTSQLSCYVRLHPKVDCTRKSVSKMLAKMKLTQASPNPAFNLDFRADGANGIPSTFSLCFEIRTAHKEVLAAKSITLQELFQDVVEEGDDVRTCLSMTSGATLEVILSHGKQGDPKEGSKKKVPKLLRSWSVHRIGKI